MVMIVYSRSGWSPAAHAAFERAMRLTESQRAWQKHLLTDWIRTMRAEREAAANARRAA